MLNSNWPLLEVDALSVCFPGAGQLFGKNVSYML